jgi:magnesium transporter
LISERTAFYLRDVYDKLARSSEMLEISRELLSNVLDAHFSLVAQRTNQIVKHLTILSAVFLPMTFVTGFFGQNFALLPFDSPLLFAIALGFCLAIPPTMLYWFRKRRWL